MGCGLGLKSNIRRKCLNRPLFELATIECHFCLIARGVLTLLIGQIAARFELVAPTAQSALLITFTTLGHHAAYIEASPGGELLTQNS